MVTNIDENMGRLMEKLDEWNLSDNTLLIFMTDNGSAAGSSVYSAGMKGAKGSPHEGGSRVPLFMRLPGLTQPGVVIDRLARHYDLFPTLAEIAGAKIPANLDLDGLSLVPLIKNPEVEWPDRTTFFHCGRWAKAGAPGKFDKGDPDPDHSKYNNFAVRNQKWRLVGNELYDMENDPGETTNVADQNPDVVRELMASYNDWWTEIRPLLVNEDASLDVPKPFVEQFKKQQANGGIPDWDPPEL
jgi:arylsulfatase